MPALNLPTQILSRLEIPPEPSSSSKEPTPSAEQINASLEAMTSFLFVLRSVFPSREAASTFTITKQALEIEVYIGDGHYFMHAYLFRPDGAYEVLEGGTAFVGPWRQGVANLIQDFLDETRQIADVYTQRVASFERLQSIVLGGALPSEDEPRRVSPHVRGHADTMPIAAES